MEGLNNIREAYQKIYSEALSADEKALRRELAADKRASKMDSKVAAKYASSEKRSAEREDKKSKGKHIHGMADSYEVEGDLVDEAKKPSDIAKIKKLNAWMNKRHQENEKARKEMMGTQAHKDMVKAAMRHFEEVDIQEETPVEKIDRISREKVAQQAAASKAAREKKAASAGKFQEFKKSHIASGGTPVSAIDAWQKQKMRKEETEIDEAKQSFPAQKVAKQMEKARKGSVYGRDGGSNSTPTDAEKKQTTRFSKMFHAAQKAKREKQEADKASRSSTFYRDTHPASAPKMKKSNEEVVMERELDPTEKREKERLVKGLKKSASDFKKRYGARAKSVMYATATKMAKDNMDTSKSDRRYGVEG